MDDIVKKKLTTLLISGTLIATSALAASEQEKLTIYTYSSFASEWGPGPKIEASFEKFCECDLEFIALDDGVTILNRLRLEGKSSEADILLGLDDSLMATAKKSNLLAKHNIDLKPVNVEDGWKDDTFVPFDYGYFAFIYNSEKLKNPPKSMKELVEERDDLKIIYQDPRTSTPGLGFMLWLKAIYGDKTSDAWKQLAAKTVTVTKGWSESYSMFLKGEADMVLSYTTSPAYHIIAEGKQQYVAASFSEGHYRQVEVAAIVKNTKHKELATTFMNFMLSDAFQSEIATGNWMYPVTNVLLPTEFEQLTLPVKMLTCDSEQVDKYRKTWTREWLTSLTE